MKLSIIPNKFAVCRMELNREFPVWAVNDIFYSITGTADELSVVTLQNSVPLGVKSETEWRIIKVKGPLDFSLIYIHWPNRWLRQKSQFSRYRHLIRII
jgi:hypothetical protein